VRSVCASSSSSDKCGRGSNSCRSRLAPDEAPSAAAVWQMGWLRLRGCVRPSCSMRRRLRPYVRRGIVPVGRTHDRTTHPTPFCTRRCASTLPHTASRTMLPPAWARNRLVVVKFSKRLSGSPGLSVLASTGAQGWGPLPPTPRDEVGTEGRIGVS
jgi:hypothetical protein